MGYEYDDVVANVKRLELEKDPDFQQIIEQSRNKMRSFIEEKGGKIAEVQKQMDQIKL